MFDIIKNAMPVLAIISILTGLIVEALKKCLDEFKVTYKANLLAALVAIVLSLGYCCGYIVLTGATLTGELVVNGIVLILMSWLTAMLGYDKIKQTLGV